jgi:hypothetical protein
MGMVLQSVPLTQLAAQYRFLPYEEIASVRILKQVPARLELALRDGRSIALHETWSGDLLTKESRDMLFAALRPYIPANA